MKGIKKKWLGIIVFIGILGIGGFVIATLDKSVEVTVITAEREDFIQYVEEIGEVYSDNRGMIYADVAGKVVDIFVEEGDTVEEGQLLMRLDDDGLKDQMENLEAQKEIIMAEYAQGIQPVDSREIEKLELEIEAQEDRIEEATRIRDLNKVLYETEVISYEDYHATETALAEANRVKEQLLLELDLLKNPASQELKRTYEAQIEQIDVEIEHLKEDEGAYEIYATQRGTVTQLMVETGSYIQLGAPAVEIVDMDALYIESDLLLEDITDITVGMEVEVHQEDIGLYGGKGIVRKIHPEAFESLSDLGIQQKRVTVEIDIKDAEKVLKVGYDVDLKFLIEKRLDTIVIPEKAIFQQDGKDYVFLCIDNVAVLQEIEKGMAYNREVEIISGIEAGDQVILSPDESIEEGISLKVVE